MEELYYVSHEETFTWPGQDLTDEVREAMNRSARTVQEYRIRRNVWLAFQSHDRLEGPLLPHELFPAPSIEEVRKEAESLGIARNPPRPKLGDVARARITAGQSFPVMVPCLSCGTLLVADAERSDYCGFSCEHHARAPWDADPDYFENLEQASD